MGMTIAEKIMARASGQEFTKPGDLIVANVDTIVFNDPTFIAGVWRDILKLHDPERMVVVFDHRVPASSREAAAAHRIGRAFVEKFGIKRFHDVGPDQGIAQVLVSDYGYALPGTVLVCPDSHTGASGAFNCAARGIGVPDVVLAATTGKTWFELGETIRYDFVGRLAPGVATKDVFLTVAETYGDHVTQNIEYGGPGLAHLGIDARRTLSTMGTELNAEFSIFEPDERLIEHVRARTDKAFEPQYADADAAYRDRRTIDLGTIEPRVALPDSIIRNTRPVGEVAGQKIDQAFIGSCANGNLEDFAIAARVLKGRKVAPHVRLIVTPGSQVVYRAALKAGYVETLMEAGALVTTATCGACTGAHMGVLGPGEICITASTRNFKGRMGDPSARIYIASPATVAASSIAGSIAHPGEFLRTENGG